MPTSPAYDALKGPVRVFIKAAPFSSDTSLKERREAVPLGRFGGAKDVVYGVLHLASDDASFVTGAEGILLREMAPTGL